LFVTSWIVAGLLRRGYSPVDDPISKLAALGADQRWIVTSGMTAFGLGCAVFAPALHGRARTALAVAAIASLGVAAFPCTEGCNGDAFTDKAHTVVAGILYLALTVTPVLHSRRPAPVVTSCVAGVALAMHVFGIGPGGLFQRIGLTTNDAWIVATALGLSRRSRSFR
jgi:hypothetical protein